MKTLKFCLMCIVIVSCDKKSDNKTVIVPPVVTPTVTPTPPADTLTAYNKKYIQTRWTLGGDNSVLITFTSTNADYNVNAPFFINTNYHNTYDIKHDTLYFNGKMSYKISFAKDTMKMKFMSGTNCGYMRKF